MDIDRGLKLPKFGFGAIVDDDIDKPWVKSHDFIKLLSECIHLGINYLDSAQLYGKNEELMGQWLSEQSDDMLSHILIGSKVSGSNSFDEPRSRLSREYVIETASRSFQKLHHKMDVFWLHSPEEDPNWVETISGFHEVLEKGLAKIYGLCNVSARQIEDILELCEKEHFIRPSLIQNQFNLIHRTNELEVVNLCRQENLQFVAYSPLTGGFLTGKYKWGENLPSGSRWAHWQTYKGVPPFWTEKTFQALDAAKELASQKGHSLAGLCLAWVKNYPGVHTVLIGPKHVDHLAPVREALDFSLGHREMQELESLFLHLV